MIKSAVCLTCSGTQNVKANVCDSCFEIACDIAESNRRMFQRLLNSGVDPCMANRIMIERSECAPS